MARSQDSAHKDSGRSRTHPPWRPTEGRDRRLHFLNDVVYRRMAPIYNAIDALSLGIWWRLVRRALDYVPRAGRVLEIGFGPGRLQAELAAQSDLSVGLDLAWGMCRFTQRRLRRSGLRHRIVQGNMFQLPFPAASFDTIVSTFALSGVVHGLTALCEMSRVSKRGGRIVIVDIGLPIDRNRMGVFWSRLWENMGDCLYDQPALMKAAGLEVVEFEEFGPGRHIRAAVGRKN